jgi:hypothetical protein
MDLRAEQEAKDIAATLRSSDSNSNNTSDIDVQNEKQDPPICSTDAVNRNRLD